MLCLKPEFFEQLSLLTNLIFLLYNLFPQSYLREGHLVRIPSKHRITSISLFEWELISQCACEYGLFVESVQFEGELRNFLEGVAGLRTLERD